MPNRYSRGLSYDVLRLMKASWMVAHHHSIGAAPLVILAKVSMSARHNVRGEGITGHSR